MNLHIIIFIFLCILAIGSAIAVITQSNPIYSALALIMNFFSFAGLYLLLNGQFIAILQIFVYAGAIMVLFVFVIMLLNLNEEKKLYDKFNFKKMTAIFFAGLFFIIVSYVFLFKGKGFLNADQSSNSINAGTVESIGKVLFSVYLIPFEFISILLIVAIIGAIVLAKRKFE